MKRSCVSPFVVVKDHATPSVWPSTTNGTPGSVPPTTLPDGVAMCARYQSAGVCRPRCGSFASNGFPVSVCSPETAPLLEPAGCSVRGDSASNAPAVGDTSAYSDLKSGSGHGLSPG